MSGAETRPSAAEAPSSKRPLVALAAGLCLAAAALVVVGSFLPLFSARLTAFGSTRLEMSITSWGFETDAPSQEGGVANNGIPLVIAAAGLSLAAVVLVMRALRGGSRARRVAAPTACLAAAFLTGVAVTVLMQALSWNDTFRPTGSAAGSSQVSVETGIGLGVWLVLAAAVLALAATGVVLSSEWRPDAGDATTPRYGFPAPMQQGGPSSLSAADAGQERPGAEEPRQGPSV